MENKELEYVYLIWENKCVGVARKDANACGGLTNDDTWENFERRHFDLVPIPNYKILLNNIQCLNNTQKIILIKESIKRAIDFDYELKTLIDTCFYNIENDIDKKENILKCFNYMFASLDNLKNTIIGIL